jgi:hypothetical protein
MALITYADIINAAFALFGETPVQDFDSDDENAQSAILLYEQIVDFNLGLQPAGFSFGREVRQLSQVADADPFTGFDYVFDIPGPTLGLPVFLTDDPSDPRCRYTDFILTGGQVHASDSPLYAMVKFRPDPHLWSPAFRLATITALAGNLAFSTTSKQSDMDNFYSRAYGAPSEYYRGGMMRAALSEEAFASPPRSIQMDQNPLTSSWRG